MVDSLRAAELAEAVIRTETILDRCGPVCEAVSNRLRDEAVATRREQALVYGRFQHPTMAEPVPHTWVLLRTPTAPGATTLLDPTIKQFEAGYAPPDVQLATVEATFDTVLVTTPETAAAAWYTPHPRSMEWTTYDGTPIVLQNL